MRLGRHASSTTPEGFAEELPKTLWELGGGNPELSEVIIFSFRRHSLLKHSTGHPSVPVAFSPANMQDWKQGQLVL